MGYGDIIRKQTLSAAMVKQMLEDTSVSIRATCFGLAAFKQKTVSLVTFKTVDAIFPFTTRAVFTDFEPFHSQHQFKFFQICLSF